MITGSLNPPRPFGRFRLTAKIASGGMATVYRAEVETGDPLYGKPLALKILHDHLSENPEFIRMFKDEGRIVQQFEHPNVVRVYEVGECDGAQYLAMEFVEGRDLAQLLVAHRLNRQVMTSAVAFEVLRQALTALKYIHGYKGRNGRVLGIVHRDISPQNLLISRQPQVKLTDFGIARGDHRSDRTRTGTVKGKMHYMSPEQARGARVDARADLYALGAVAYEMLTGQPLFGPGTTEVLQARAVSGQIEFGNKFDRLAPDVQDWLKKSLCRDENQRFHSADAMLAAMELIPKASKSLYKPEALLRLMDLPEARRSRQRDQRLFINDEESSGRLSSGAVLAPKPPAHTSALPPGNHTDLDREARMQRLGVGALDSRIDWNAASAVELKPVTGVRSPNADLERARRRSQVGLLPAEVAVGKSYRPEGVVDSPARPATRTVAPKIAEPVEALEPGSLKNPKKPEDIKPARTGKTSGMTRTLAPEQQGLALAGVVAWACGALILFAVLLEVTGSQVHLPEVTDQSLAQLFDDDEAPATRTDAVAGAKKPSEQQALPVPMGPAAFRAKPALRSAGNLVAEADKPTVSAPAAKAAAAPVASAVESELKRAKAEKAAQRAVELRAERLAWADKPLEKVEKPEAKAKPVVAKAEAAPAAAVDKPVAAKAAAPAEKPAVARPVVPVAKPVVPLAKPAVAKPVAPAAKPAVAKPAVPAAKPAVAKPAVPAVKPAVAKPAVPVAKPAVAKPALPAAKPAVAKPAVPAGKPGPASAKQGVAPLKQGVASPKQAVAPAKQGVASPKQAVAPAKQGAASPKPAVAPAKQGVASPKQAVAPAKQAVASPKPAVAPGKQAVASPKQAVAAAKPAQAAKPAAAKPVAPAAKPAPHPVARPAAAAKPGAAHAPAAAAKPAAAKPAAPHAAGAAGPAKVGATAAHAAKRAP